MTTKKQKTATEVKTLLDSAGIYFDQVTKSKTGTFLCRKGYFYRMGTTADSLANSVTKRFKDWVIVDTKDNWEPFKGGRPLKNSSHFLVEIKIIIN